MACTSGEFGIEVDLAVRSELMKTCALVVFCVLGLDAVQSSAAQGTPADVIGCISQIPNGGLQLRTTSGTEVALQGDVDQLLRHTNYLVRIRGRQNRAFTGKPALPAFTVQSIELISDTCTSGLPPRQAVPVEGKVGEGEVAVPISTSMSAGQATPGYQTETVIDQEPPASGRSPVVLNIPKSPYSPSSPAQVAQTANDAERYAEAATLCEIQPGKTRGVNGYGEQVILPRPTK